MSPKPKPKALRGPLLPGIADIVGATAELAIPKPKPRKAAKQKTEDPKRRPGRPKRPVPPAERAKSAFLFFLGRYRDEAGDAGIENAQELAAEALRIYDSGDQELAVVHVQELAMRNLLARLKNTLDFALVAGFAVLPDRVRAEFLGAHEDDRRRLEQIREEDERLYSAAMELKSRRPSWLEPDAPPRKAVVDVATFQNPPDPEPPKPKRKPRKPRTPKTAPEERQGTPEDEGRKDV